ncbi:MAG TPA: hypothetical protein PKA41_17090 [Verrucomicrobiota bacterium]|nr:hypothetical protein [Verrucomicrobiota bacterium]
MSDRSDEPTLDGNLPASRLAKTGFALPGVALHPGEELFLRWSDVNDNGPDDGLAIDDFSMTCLQSRTLAVVEQAR